MRHVRSRGSWPKAAMTSAPKLVIGPSQLQSTSHNPLAQYLVSPQSAPSILCSRVRSRACMRRNWLFACGTSSPSGQCVQILRISQTPCLKCYPRSWASQERNRSLPVDKTMACWAMLLISCANNWSQQFKYHIISKTSSPVVLVNGCSRKPLALMPESKINWQCDICSHDDWDKVAGCWLTRSYWKRRGTSPGNFKFNLSTH